MQNIFVKDGSVVDREVEGAQEYAPLSLLKQVSLRVKPLRWTNSLMGASALGGLYEVVNRGNAYDVLFDHKPVIQKPMKTLLSAQAVAQQHHEERVLGYLDLGAWTELKR